MSVILCPWLVGVYKEMTGYRWVRGVRQYGRQVVCIVRRQQKVRYRRINQPEALKSNCGQDCEKTNIVRVRRVHPITRHGAALVSGSEFLRGLKCVVI